MSLTVVDVAKVCHAASKMYCELRGDNSQELWEHTDEALQASAIQDVSEFLVAPNRTPRAAHEAWVTHKASNGWKWGESEDVQKKLHPHILDYDSLNEDQKQQGILFLAVCRALLSKRRNRKTKGCAHKLEAGTKSDE